MGYKSTITVTREQALSIVLDDVHSVGNDILAGILDLLADSKQSRHLSYFNNFVVSNVV